MRSNSLHNLENLSRRFKRSSTDSREHYSGRQVLAAPDNVAVLAWFGVDLFDASRTRFALSSDHLLTSYGPRLPLSGETCNMDVAIHHYQQAIRSVQSAIEHGALRRLAQQQSLNSPRLVEHMRHFDALSSATNGVLRASMWPRIHRVYVAGEPP